MSTANMPVVLTVRGTVIPESLEAARRLHNETAGSAPGIAAARALGDLSHNVYAPCTRYNQSGAKPGELLFLDRWDNPKGIMEFFGNPHVQQQAGKLFGARDAAVWMAAQGSFSYALPAPHTKSERYVGMIRASVKSPEASIAIFAGVDAKVQRDARRRGLLSHELFVKLNAPGDSSPVELLGIDLWSDFDGMSEQYSDQTHMSVLGPAFAGPPQTSVWEAAPGNWSEW
jgi:hypothetical protein